MRRGALPVDWLARAAAAAYLVMLAFNMAGFSPETHVSTGVHQLPGACDVQDTDITGQTRGTFLCVEDFDEDFTFACAAPPAHGTQWFTVCGKAHTRYAAHAAGVGALALLGLVVFSTMFGALRRAPEDAEDADTRTRDRTPRV